MKFGGSAFNLIFAQRNFVMSARTITRKYAARLLALALISGAYYLARVSDISLAERAQLSQNFHFQRLPLAELGGQKQTAVRQVNPSLQRISAWVSSVGAAVALNDLDEDGLPNDVCYVDPRVDQVILAPVPGSLGRYQPFSLDAGSFYDSATMAPMGTVPADLNEDGLMDLVVYYWGRSPLAFLRKQQPGLSRENFVVTEIVAGGERWYTNAATVADLDGDGHLDLVVGNYYADGARILDANSPVPDHMQHSMSRAFNGGGNRFLRWTGSTGGSAPTVSFKLIADAIEKDQEENISRGWTLAVGTADLDGDLMPEVYFANDFGPDRLLHNRSKPGYFRFVLLEGIKTFTTPSSKVLGRDSFKGMGVDFGDLNGDGFLDIYVSNIAGKYALEESHFAFISTGETARMWEGVAPYVDGSEALGLSRSGWGWDVKLGDFDNDGMLEVLQATGFTKGEAKRWPELHELAMGNDQALQYAAAWPRFQPGDALSDDDHNPFFVRARDNRFYDLAAELGLAQRMISRGIATADVDGDGDLDFAIANQWETSYFFQNQNVHSGAFVGIHLRLPIRQEGSALKVYPGHVTNGTLSRPAIGSTVNIQLPNGKHMVAQTDGGNGHSGKRSPDLLFGLGSLPPNAILKVQLHWRDQQGRVQSSALNLSPGWYTVFLGAAEGGTR
jgi:enediyne biosynthesis protein E4